MANETQRTYRIPVVRVMMVKDSSQASAVRQVKCPGDAAILAQAFLAGADREHFIILLMDTKNKVTGINTVSVGSLSASIVHPREVFKPAIIANAAGIILAHNHPSGDPTPSWEDIKVTQRLVEAGELLQIPVLDHVVLGDDCHISLKQQALM